MKKSLASAAIAAALLTSVSTKAHTPLDIVPDLESFTEWVQSWEVQPTLYNNQQLDVVDVHLHPGSYEKLGPKGKEFVKSVFPINLPDSLKVPLLSFFSRTPPKSCIADPTMSPPGGRLCGRIPARLTPVRAGWFPG